MIRLRLLFLSAIFVCSAGAPLAVQAKLCSQVVNRPIFVTPPRDNVIHEYKLNEDMSLLMVWGELEGMRMSYGIRLDGKLVFFDMNSKIIDLEQDVVVVKSNKNWIVDGVRVQFELRIDMGPNDFGRPTPTGYEVSFREINGLGFPRGPEQLVARVEQGALEYLQSYKTQVFQFANSSKDNPNYSYFKLPDSYFSSSMRAWERN